MMGEIMATVSEVSLSTVSEKVVANVENLEPIIAESSTASKRPVDMELFASVICMLKCHLCKSTGWYNFAGRL